MKTVVGVVLAVVLAAGAGVLATVVTANVAITSVDKAASNADPANVDAPDDYGVR